jgi:hypothetical protein
LYGFLRLEAIDVSLDDGPLFIVAEVGLCRAPRVANFEEAASWQKIIRRLAWRFEVSFKQGIERFLQILSAEVVECLSVFQERLPG